MLLIVSPNLCLDRIVVVRGFLAGRVHRAESATELASGKGLNVARVARALGVEVTVVGIVGGDGANAIVEGARDRGIRLDAVRVPGPVRVCTLIIDPGHEETVINEPGPEVGADTGRALQDHIDAGLHQAQAVILAGSLPPGLRPTFYADVIRRAHHTIPVILDATGEALRLGMSARPHLVKANRLELQDAVGRPLDSVKAVSVAAEEIHTTTGGGVLITLGDRGALLCAAEGVRYLVPPHVERISTIGAGDSLTAGLAAGLLRNLPMLEAARLGIAAAAADVTTLLPGTVDADLVAELVPRVTVGDVREGPEVFAK